MPSGGGIDHERVHNENFLIRRFKLPRRTGVYIDLYLIQNSGRGDFPVGLRDEEIAARERSLRRGAHGIYAASPAGRGAPGFLFGEYGVVNGGYIVNIGCRCFAERRRSTECGNIIAHFCSSFTVGSVMVNTFPDFFPSQRIFPPCSNTMLSAMERPRP